MNEANQIQRDIRRRLEKMSLQELKEMHAKTLEIMEKWQLTPASPSLEHPIVKRIEEIDNTRQNEFIVGTPGTAKNYGFAPDEKPTIDIDDLENSLEMHEMREIEIFDVTEQKKIIVTACKDFNNEDDNEYTYLLHPNGWTAPLDRLNDRKFFAPNEPELEKEMKKIEAFSKSIEEFVKNEHGVDTPFTEYKYGEFHFGNKEDGKSAFKIVEGKDDYFEIHIENEDFEDGWETFTAFHKDELDLDIDLKPQMKQQQEIHEMTIER